MLKKSLLKELRAYVDNHLIEEVTSSLYEAEIFSSEEMEHELEDYILTNQKASFSTMLFAFIDEKGYKDADVYKKAGIDRRHFSKIRSKPDYQISKPKAVSLAIALGLNKKETEQLLMAAGFSLSDHDIFDLVIRFCLERDIYDIDHVNHALNYFKLKPL